MTKIAIVGTAPSWKEAPFDDESWQIWSFNRTGVTLPRWDVLFEIHRRFPDNPTDAEYLKDLGSVAPPKKIYSLIPLAKGDGPFFDFRKGVNIVIDREQLYKRWWPGWLSSSITYAFAHAIDKKPTDIALFGIEFESREEYVVQFAGCRHMMDICKERGITVHLPDGCLLARNPEPYPDRFETLFAVTLEKKAARCQALIVEWEGHLEKAKLEAYGTIGQITEMENRDVPKDEIAARKKLLDREIRYLERVKAAVNRLKGELMSFQQMKRLFVWNALPPEIGEESDADTADCGPV